MEIGMRFEQRQKLEQRVSIEQKFHMRIALIQALSGDRYEPKAKCPKCFRELTVVEILKGFNRDPNDFTTSCTGCKSRFQAKLVSNDGGEVVFFCPAQTLDQLRGNENRKPVELKAGLSSALYHSAFVHFGSLKNAFREIGVAYEYEEVPDWKEKVVGFLGAMSDTLISECVGVSASIIRRMRRARNISKYTALPL